MTDAFGEDDWQPGEPDIGSLLDEIQVCAGSLDALTHSMSGLRDLPQSEKDGILRSLRDLHRRVDDAEVEASRII